MCYNFYIINSIEGDTTPDAQAFSSCSTQYHLDKISVLQKTCKISVHFNLFFLRRLETGTSVL